MEKKNTNKDICLKENRILPKEELYKRVILQYLEKSKKFNKKIILFRDCNPIMENEYYIDENFTIDNWEEYLRANINNENFFSEDNLKVADLNKSLQIDTKTNTAGFDKPIIYNIYVCSKGYYNVMLDKSFYFTDGNFIKMHVYIRGHSKDRHSNDKNLNEYIHYYKEKIRNKKGFKTKFDNCGNTDYDVDKEFKKIKGDIGKGG